MAQTHSLDLESGSSQYASISDASQTGLDITGDITLEAWFKAETLPSNAQMRLVSKYLSTGSQRGYSLFLEDVSGTLSLKFDYSDNGTTVYGTPATVSLSTGTWYHVAATLDASTGTVKLYLNGREVTSNVTAGRAILNNTAPFETGAMQGLAYFDGLIKDVRVFSDIRTQSEIIDDAHTENVTDANLEGEWNFNNAYTDSSGNSNDLTASGSPVFSTDIPWEAPTGIDGSTYLETNLLSYYTLDEASGTREDSTASGHDLTDGNTVGSVAGVIENAADFEADNSEYLSAGTTTDFNFTTGDFSVAMWVNMESLVTDAALVNHGAFNEDGWQINLFDTSGGVEVRFSTTGASTRARWDSILSAGAGYQHLVFTRTGTTIRCYVDGIDQGAPDSSTISGNPQSNTSRPLYLGAASQSGSGYAAFQFLDGQMDEVGIYTRVLHYGDVLDLYNDGSAIPYVGTTEYDQALTANAQALATLNKGMYKAMDVTAQASALLQSGLLYAKELIANAEATASMIRNEIRSVILTVTAEATATFTKLQSFFKTLTVTAQASATEARLKTLSKILTATAQATTSITRGLVVARTLVVTASATVTIGLQKELTKVITTTAQAVVSLLKDYGYIDKYPENEATYEDKYPEL